MKKTVIKLLAAAVILAVCFHITACNNAPEEKPIATATTPVAADSPQTEATTENTEADTTPAPQTTTEKPETDLITSEDTKAPEETAADTSAPQSAAPETTPQQSEAPAFTPTGSTRDDIAALAQAQVGKMFFFGGCTPEQGFDNSGLVYYALTQNGVECPRYTDGIVAMGSQVAYDNLQKGDVVVFKMDDEDGYKFVGIYIGDGKAVISTTDDQPVKTVDMTSNWYQNAFQYGISIA